MAHLAQQTSRKCLCCRVKFEEDEGNGTIDPNVFECGQSSRANSEGLKVLKRADLNNRSILNFDKFCSLLGLSQRFSDFHISPDFELDEGGSHFCSNCSEVILSLVALQDVLEKTKSSIDDKLKWIRTTVIDAGSGVNTLSSSVKEDNSSEPEDDPRFCFIRTEILQSLRRDDNQFIAAEVDSTNSGLDYMQDKDVEIKLESPDRITEFDNNFEATDFELGGCNDLQVLNNIEPGDSFVIPDDFHLIEQEGSESLEIPASEVCSQDSKVSGTGYCKRITQDRGSWNLQSKSIELGIQHPYVEKSFDHPVSVRPGRPSRQKKTSVRLFDYEDPLKIDNADFLHPKKNKYLKSDQQLLRKFNLEKSPELRIILEDVCKTSQPLSLTNTRQLTGYNKLKKAPSFQKVATKRNRKNDDINADEKLEIESWTISKMARSTAANRTAKYKGLKKSKKLRLEKIKQRLDQNSQQYGMKIRKIFDESDQENETSKNDPDFHPSNDDSGGSNYNSGSECNSGSDTEDKDYQDYQHASKTRRNLFNRENDNKGLQIQLKPSNRLKNTIEIRNGKRFYRTDEIVEDGDHWLCPYKSCDFKMLKDEDSKISDQNMLHHLRTIHANDNYYCELCQKFFKWLKELIRHNSKCHPQKRSHQRRVRLKSTVVTKNGKFYYRNREIFQEGNYCLCPYNTCDFKMLREENEHYALSCKEMNHHLKQLHSNDNYWCKLCEKYFSTKKDLYRHKHARKNYRGEKILVRARVTVSDIESNSDSELSEINKVSKLTKNYRQQTKKGRNYLKNTINTTNGRRYYRDQEILENDNHWLCPYKTCSFKIVKGEDDAESTRNMLAHLRILHAKDNYWCKVCEKYFGTIKELYRHKHTSKSLPGKEIYVETETSKSRVNISDIEFNSDVEISEYKVSKLTKMLSTQEPDKSSEVLLSQKEATNRKRKQILEPHDLESSSKNVDSNADQFLESQSCTKYKNIRTSATTRTAKYKGMEKSKKRRLEKTKQRLDQKSQEYGMNIKTVFEDTDQENEKSKDDPDFHPSDDDSGSSNYNSGSEYNSGSDVEDKDYQDQDYKIASDTRRNTSKNRENDKTGLQIKRHPRNRLKNTIEIRNGKRYYRTDEIVEEGDHWLCPYKSCDFKTLKDEDSKISDQNMLYHLRTIHANDNYYCEHCQKYFKHLKEFVRHNVKSKCHPRFPRKRFVGESIRRRLKSTILTKNGRRYYRDQEIFGEDNHWLCPYKICVFKIVKDEDDDHSMKEMQTHLRTVHAKDNYLCKLCEKYFQTLGELNIHSRNSHPGKEIKVCPTDDKFPCDYCEIIFETLVEQRNHHKEQHFGSEMTECKICKKPIKISNLTHKWMHLNKEEREAWEAQGKVNPLAHSKLPTDKFKPNFQCAKCGKQFSLKHQLLGHEKTHIPISQRPKIICEKCGNEFTTTSGLRYHMIRVHNPVGHLTKWKVCMICDKRYLHKTHLDIHMRRFHGAEKVHKCDKCPRSFAGQSDLKRHGVVHMLDHRPYKCPFCKSAYRYNKNLDRHIKRAHADKNYVNPASKEFSWNIKLKPDSLPVMTCKQMYPCEICEKAFPMRSRLKKHMTKSHGHKYVYDDAEHEQRKNSSNLNENESSNVWDDMEDPDFTVTSSQIDQVEVDSAIESIENEKDIEATFMLVC